VITIFFAIYGIFHSIYPLILCSTLHYLWTPVSCVTVPSSSDSLFFNVQFFSTVFVNLIYIEIWRCVRNLHILSTVFPDTGLPLSNSCKRWQLCLHLAVDMLKVATRNSYRPWKFSCSAFRFRAHRCVSCRLDAYLVSIESGFPVAASRGRLSIAVTTNTRVHRPRKRCTDDYIYVRGKL